MIALLVLLLAAGAARIDETLEVPPGQWRSIDLQLEQAAAVIECRHVVLSGGSGVRVTLMHRTDLERLRDGVRHRVLAGTPYQKAGGFRWGPGPLGDYSIVVDNRLEGRGPARVRVAVALRFPHSHAGELSSARKLGVILITVLVMGVLIAFVVRKLGWALLGRS